MNIDSHITVQDVARLLPRFWQLSDIKIRRIEREFDPALGAPVFTVNGRYTARGWTEWTQGFQFGSMLLQFDAVDDAELLERGRRGALRAMPPHITHRGVHDHGFNTISTFGALRRLVLEGRAPAGAWEREYYELAIKTSAAVQAMRWTSIRDGGFIYSFNGPHSLFADTIRSLRVLALGHRLGHVLMDENDTRVSLLQRLILHARTTARYTVYYGEGRDAYDDTPGRVAHESIFNTTDGRYRCPNSQQGYSPFSTWTRGLAWIMLGFAEQLEFLDTLEPEAWSPFAADDVRAFMEKAASAACDFYITHSAADGVPYWDTGAPGLHHLGNWRERPAEPFNEWEPVDSSAAAIAAQALLRFGHWLIHRETPDDHQRGQRYFQAGLTVLNTLLHEPYLAADTAHHGLILHSVYHRPNGWDHIPPGRNIPCGEASMWGDYHAREAALLVQRIADHKPYLTFWGPDS